MSLQCHSLTTGNSRLIVIAPQHPSTATHPEFTMHFLTNAFYFSGGSRYSMHNGQSGNPGPSINLIICSLECVCVIVYLLVE
jgi:hypothetical protein